MYISQPLLYNKYKLLSRTISTGDNPSFTLWWQQLDPNPCLQSVPPTQECYENSMWVWIIIYFGMEVIVTWHQWSCSSCDCWLKAPEQFDLPNTTLTAKFAFYIPSNSETTWIWPRAGNMSFMHSGMLEDLCWYLWMGQMKQEWCTEVMGGANVLLCCTTQLGMDEVACRMYTENTAKQHPVRPMLYIHGHMLQANMPNLFFSSAVTKCTITRWIMNLLCLVGMQTARLHRWRKFITIIFTKRFPICFADLWYYLLHKLDDGLFTKGAHWGSSGDCFGCFGNNFGENSRKFSE